ncbi:MAG: hypothetical protein ACREME_04775, partial [Gemmatimonadales bacterium]
MQRRHLDGAYRFLSAPHGVHRILWREPFRRTQDGWARWAEDDPQVTLPRPDPTVALEVELWPAADAAAPGTATGVRGKLVGADAGGLTVLIALPNQPFDRFTRTDASGEFLFLPPGMLPPTAAGRVPLTIEVRTPAGVVRPIAPAGGAFAGQLFTIAPQTVPRVLFRLA